MRKEGGIHSPDWLREGVSLGLCSQKPVSRVHGGSLSYWTLPDSSPGQCLKRKSGEGWMGHGLPHPDPFPGGGQMEGTPSRCVAGIVHAGGMA